MYQIDLNRPQHVHFIGIGGISMSGLAEILMNRGFAISGSDSKKSALTESLEERGARLYYGQRASNISDDIELIVYSAAIHPDNPEYARGASLGLPMLSRAELLGQIMKGYPTAIAVAGTHGKTTTTSMLAHILMEANTDPTISVGGILPSIGGNIRVGNSDYFLTEACEYTNSFLSFFPTMAIILNMDADHLDFFSGIEEIRESFRRFALLVPEGGQVIISADTPHYEDILKDLTCEKITFSLTPEAADYWAENITYDEAGRPTFLVKCRGEEIGTFSLSVPGIHNVSNSLAAIAAGRILSIPEETIKKALLGFTGTDRRFQFKGEIGGVSIIDDYAHHPTEISATLTAASAMAHKKLWCVFQPHTYSRTKALLHEFAEALSKADEVVLADIYAARENDDLGISSEVLQGKIQELGCPCAHFPTFDAIEAYLLTNAEPGDMILTMGAGDIFRVGEHLLGN